LSREITQIPCISFWMVIVLASLSLLSTMNRGHAQPQEGSSITALIDSLMDDLHVRGLFNGAVILGRDGAIVYEGS
jgi:hypothetical protein